MEKHIEMNIGVPKFNSLAGALAEIYGKDIRLGQSFRIPGGDINKAYGMQLSNGKILFMKTNEKQKVDLFLSEAINLWAISLTNTINTPKLLAYGTDDSEEIGYSFLLMEYIELGDIKDEFWN
ncbi:MAG: fructosamine kinase family protein, partial [Treponema sp.]|nr:fructosamine kinase family protein [Treponema sp.]